MKKLINKYKNYHPSKWEALSFLLIPIFIGLLTATSFSGDIYFLLNQGRYILNHGFPHIDPFTMHEGLKLVIQQWIPDVLFYISYKYLGKFGVYTIPNLINILFVFVSYKLCMLVTDNKRNLSVLLTLFSSLLISLSFVVPRPQIMSLTLLVLELYVLEHYFKNDNPKVLLWLPIISLLLINIHASMWLLLFCFWLPFFLNTFKYKVGIVNSNTKTKKYLLLAFIGMFLVGFINPYGFDAMSYVINSYGVKSINYIVIEMQPPTITSVVGIKTYAIVFIVILIYLLTRIKELESRHLFLLLGTMFLAFSSERGFAFFVISCIYPLGYYYKDNFYKIKENKKLTNKTKVLFIINCIIFIVIPYLIITTNSYYKIDSHMKKGIDYLYENEDINKMRLYCDYGECSYAEWLGIKPFIDSRAEVFVKKNNKKEDIIGNLYDLKKGTYYYKYFLEKYDFTHLIVGEGDPLYTLLIVDDNYEIIYSDQSIPDTYKLGYGKDEPFDYVILKKK